MNILLYVLFTLCLALAIVICNATVLGVLSLRKKDAQSIYRLSLAVADLIMGIFAIPISFGTEHNHLVQSPPFANLRNVTGYVIANDSSLQIQPAVVKVKDLLPDTFSSSSISAFGFFNGISVIVSVCSLVAASFDRFVAIVYPLRYNEVKAIFAAKITVASVWTAGLIFAVLLTAISDKGYSSHFAKSVLAGRKYSDVVMGIALFFALVLMWFLVISTYVAARPSLRRHDRQRHTNDEMRLLGTLGIMIAVFTVCIAPKAITLIIGVYLPHVYLSKPADFNVVTAMRFVYVRRLAGGVVVSNSLWNCFIYGIREKKFRTATKLLYKRIAQRLKLDQAWNMVSRKT